MDEDTRYPGERGKGSLDTAVAVDVTEIVAGVHDQVGLEARERTYEVLLGRLPRRHVEVA